MDTPSTVRAQLGERIPEGGTESDTMFTDGEILDLISTYGAEGAVLEGWRRKAAEFANLVDTTEGTSKRAMSNLHQQALEQVRGLEAATAAAQPRTRIHQIKRSY